jgi:hypothetical protein
MRYAARQDGAGSESPPKKKNPAQAGGQVTRERNSRTAGGIGEIGEPSCSP